MKLKFNEERAVKLFTILQDLWDRKTGVFEGVVLPQDRWPVPADPDEAANYFSYAAITQRGGVVSEDPFKWINHLRQTDPKLFDPHLVSAWYSIEQIMEVIKKAVTDRQSWYPQQHQGQLFDIGQAQKPSNGKNEKLYKLDEFARAWAHNSGVISQRWRGSVLNVFFRPNGIPVADFEEAFARVDYKNPNNQPGGGLIGMRRKIFSLFTIWLQEKNYIPIFPTPIPVDFHALRLLFATKVVTWRGQLSFQVTPGIHPEHLQGRPIVRVTEKITDEVAEWSQLFLVRHGFSHLAINPALWVLSRELCPNEFQNQSTGRGRKGSRGNIQLIYPEKLKKDPNLWPHPYIDPALVCPVAEICKLAIPNSPYYSFGLLALLKRLPYPHQLLPEVKRILHPRRRKNNRK